MRRKPFDPAARLIVRKQAAGLCAAPFSRRYFVMTKKLMALLLAVLMAVSLLPMPAMAGDAQVITDLSGISAGGSYVVDKSVKDIVLSAPLTLDKDVTLELTGQTVTLKLADGESYADASVFHVESGSLTLKGSGTVKV